MKKILLFAIALQLLQNCFSQKIELEHSVIAVKPEITSDSTSKNTNQTITLTFVITGSATDSIVINLKHIEAEMPPCFVGLATKTITFNKAEFPGNTNAINTVTKTVDITTKPVSDLPGDYEIAIMPDDVITHADSTTIIVNSNAAIVHFNASGTIPYLKYDSTNTIKTDFAFYTDFLGVDNERPNGLYQVELGFKCPVCHNKDIRFGGTNSFFQIFRSLYLNMNLLSLDNTLKEDVNNASAIPRALTDSNTQLGIDTVLITKAGGGTDTAFKALYAKRKLINGFDLYQWASFSAKVKFNLLNLVLGNHNIYLSYNVGILRTPIYDSLFNKRIHVTSFINGPELYYETHFKVGSPLFNFRCVLDYYRLRLWNNDLEQVNAPLLKYNTQSKYLNYYEDANVAKIFQGSFRIAYLFKQKATDDDNQVFLRIGYSLQSTNINNVQFHNGYTQVQFGALFDIGKILKNIKSPDDNDTGSSNSTQTTSMTPTNATPSTPTITLAAPKQ